MVDLADAKKGALHTAENIELSEHLHEFIHAFAISSMIITGRKRQPMRLRTKDLWCKP